MPYFVKKDLKPDLTDAIIRKGQSVSFEFDSEGLSLSDHHRLYFTCEDRFPYVYKDEPYGDKLYMLIEDSLCESEAMHDRFCLDMSEKEPKPFVKLAASKYLWGPSIGIFKVHPHTDEWDFGIFAKADGFKIHKGGYMRLRFERWDKREGIPPEVTGDFPNETILVDIPEGSYGYTDFSKTISIDDKKTACIIVTLEGENYSGNIYFERPHLTASCGTNLTPAFDTVIPAANDRYRNTGWLGMNLSRKEWPRFEIALNGKVFFEGEKFLRIHRYSPVEIDIPDGLIKESNTLTIKYTSDYRGTVPLAIRELKLTEKKKQPFHVHFCPDAVEIGKDIPLLIETEAENMQFTVKSDLLSITGEDAFESTGLHVLTLTAKEYKNNMEFTLCSGGYSIDCKVRKSIPCKSDNVVAGSGDLIYIDNSSVQDVSDYLEWAFYNKTHSLITIRPAYRWGGQRTINPKVWELLCDVCNKMGVDYVHMSDGRDLPGLACNPSPDMLKGEHFLGVQNHERDGQLFYWAVTPIATYPTHDTFFDLSNRLFRENPLTTESNAQPFNYLMQREKMSFMRNIDCKADMKDAHDTALRSLRFIRCKQVTRHTGPSVMFKYFYESGYDWTGAETMDSSTEPLLSFLRGAAKAYGKKRTGAHHAVQWSTSPHDTNERKRRFAATNLVTYMHGVTDINTEEGLWFLESEYSYHNRYSVACTNHVQGKQNLYRYIASHSRSGEFYTKIAFVHGRFDGWNGFGGLRLFGMPHILGADPEKSWELMKVFYPLSKITLKTCHTTGHKPENSGKPFGLLTGTPYGCIDVMPIENGDFSDYALTVFASYNAAVKEDMDKMYDYIERGGTVLATLAHFSTVTDRARIENNDFELIDHPITKAITGEGDVIDVKLGKGRLVVINKMLYPANEQIESLYKDTLIKLTREVLEKEPAQVICDERVEYVCYRQKSGALHFYVTAVDWYNSPEGEREFSLRVGKDVYPLTVGFGQIRKIYVDGSQAVWCEDTDFDILEDGSIVGEGKTKVFTAKDGNVEAKEIIIK